MQDWFVQPFTQGLAAVSTFLVQAFDSTAVSEGIILHSLTNEAAVQV